MHRANRIITLAAAVALLAGAADAALTRDKIIAEADDDEAVLYLVAGDPVRWAGRTYPRDPVTFWADDSFVGRLEKPAYTFAKLEPGRVLLWADEPRLQREIDLAAGSETYVRLWDLAVLPEDEGRALVDAATHYEIAAYRDRLRAGRRRADARQRSERWGDVLAPWDDPAPAEPTGVCRSRRVRIGEIRLHRTPHPFMQRGSPADVADAVDRLSAALAAAGFELTEEADAPRLDATLYAHRDDVPSRQPNPGFAPRGDVLRLSAALREADGATVWLGTAEQPDTEPTLGRIARRAEKLAAALATACRVGD